MEQHIVILQKCPQMQVFPMSLGWLRPILCHSYFETYLLAQRNVNECACLIWCVVLCLMEGHPKN